MLTAKQGVQFFNSKNGQKNICIMCDYSMKAVRVSLPCVEAESVASRSFTLLSSGWVSSVSFPPLKKFL